MRLKKLVSTGLIVVTALAMLMTTGCGSGTGNKEGEGSTFSWWIYSADGVGTFYDKYENHPVAQWLNQQYWDVENGTLGTEENGTNIQFTYQVPIAGAEQDNFNTMLATGEYTDILDLSMASDSAEVLCAEGILMELTDYVEKYCPNYVEFLDRNPDQKALVTTVDDEGKTHYYQMACITDGNTIPWGGYVYRRDWVVKYAEPTEYVWDWDSDYVKENGHPAVTPLEAAEESGNLEGWKKNEVTAFTSSDGDEPNYDYTDNVIFPSGMTDPYTISDWEWMFEAFQKAIDERGFSGNSDAYCTTVYYPGYFQVGDLVSSFGGGAGTWSKDAEQEVSFNGTSENFKTYLECLHNWNERGWLDSRFETRASDMFFSINQTGTAQGMVGLWYGTLATMGDVIRVTCADAEDQQDAYVMPCSVPVNDVYGTDDQKFKEPDAFYQGSRIAGSIGITTKAEEKDLAALFTFFNWMYTKDGAMITSVGLNKEQQESCEIKDSVYEEYDCEDLYTITDGEDGKEIITLHYPRNIDIASALKLQRLAVGMQMTGAGPDLDYIFVDEGKTQVQRQSEQLYTRYTNTASLLDFDSSMTAEESNRYSEVNTAVNDYMAQKVPTLIKEGLDGWDQYVSGVNNLGVQDVTDIYQDVVDRLFKGSED